MSIIFLYRLKDSDDRDCCAYIKNSPFRFECGHYFGAPYPQGSCYSGVANWPAYDEIETVLTREEYQALIDFSKAIGDLGYGIKKGDERYQRGLNLCADVSYVYDKLNSDEAEKFFLKIQESEKEFLMKNFKLDKNDVEDIFGNYYLEYRDRSIVGCVYEDVEDCAENEAYDLGYVERNSVVERYFNFEKFGEDLLEEEQYYQLKDGRIVYLNY